MDRMMKELSRQAWQLLSPPRLSQNGGDGWRVRVEPAGRLLMCVCVCLENLFLFGGDGRGYQSRRLD